MRTVSIEGYTGPPEVVAVAMGWGDGFAILHDAVGCVVWLVSETGAPTRSAKGGPNNLLYGQPQTPPSIYTYIYALWNWHIMPETITIIYRFTLHKRFGTHSICGRTTTVRTGGKTTG